MKKVGILLHETSIINFPFVWKLIKRYYIFTMVIPLIVFSVFSYKYLSQKSIFYVELGFKNVAASTGGSASSAIFSALGEQSNILNPYEIISMGQNVDFLHKLAEKIHSREDFHKLNFNNFTSKKVKTHEEIFKPCGGDKDCEIKMLTGILKGQFSIKQDNLVESQFRLGMRSIDKNSAMTVVMDVADTLNETRLKALQKFIGDQIEITKNLADKKKKELEAEGVEQLMEDIKQNEVLLEGVITQLNQYQRSYLVLQEQMTSAETVLDQTKKTINTNVDFDKLAKSKRAKVLKDQIEKLREDIASVELANSSFYKSDSKVIKTLKKDLTNKENEYKSIIKSSRGLSSFDSFLDNKNKTASYSEFDFAVMKKKFQEAKKRYDNLKVEKEKIIHTRSELQTKLDQVKPSVEYYKLLKEKLVQLELASSTVVSDLQFDTKISTIQRYKRLSKTKVIMASISISGFLTMMCLLLCYLFDNRIYDEEELKSNFSDLEIIGNTPDFQ